MLSGYNLVSRTGMGLICLPTVLNPLVACWLRSMGVMRDGCARSMLAARNRVDCMLGSFVSEWRGVRGGSIATRTSRCWWWWWWCCLLRLLPSSLPARSSAELRTRQPSSPPSNQRHACTGHAAVPLPCSSTTSPSAAARWTPIAKDDRLLRRSTHSPPYRTNSTQIPPKCLTMRSASPCPSSS